MNIKGKKKVNEDFIPVVYLNGSKLEYIEIDIEKKYDLEMNPHLTDRFQFKEATYTRKINTRGDRIYSKTSIKKETLSPYWDESFHFIINNYEADIFQLDLMDKDAFSEEIIGNKVKKGEYKIDLDF